MHHHTIVVKVHDQNPIFLVDCDVSGVNKSTEVNQCDNHNYNFFMVETELNMVAQ